MPAHGSSSAFERVSQPMAAPSPGFTMPAGLFIRFDPPAPELADIVTSYHIYTADSAEERVDWFLPGTADISVSIDAGPISVTIRRRTYDPLPQASLMGPMSQAMRAVTRGGSLIGIGLTPLGWSRFVSRGASDFRDRILPLHEAVSPSFARELVSTLAATDRNHDVKPALDALLIRHLRPPHPDAPQIARMMAMIVDGRMDGLSRLTSEMGLPAHTLRRLAARHFGFPPKMLLLRARFLHSFTRMALAGDTLDYSTIASTYYDASHFLRDARAFLGTTPKRFMALPTTFLQGSLHARAAALGTAAQVLHTLDGTSLDQGTGPP